MRGHIIVPISALMLFLSVSSQALPGTGRTMSEVGEMSPFLVNLSPDSSAGLTPFQEKIIKLLMERHGMSRQEAEKIVRLRSCK